MENNNNEVNQKILSEYGRKATVLLFVGIMLLASYLFIKYLLPLLWPFIIGLFLAMVFKPVIWFLKKFFHLNRMIGTAMVLSAVSAVIVILTGWLIRGILSQITVLMENMDMYMKTANEYLCSICYSIGDTVGVEGEMLFRMVSKNIAEFMVGMESKITNVIMGMSIPTIMAFVEFIVGIALVVVSLFLFVKDTDTIREYFEKFYFSREVRFIGRRVVSTTKAYIRAQLIIMAVIGAECVAGLMLLGNKYALLIGILIGILDALPLLGVGAILIPWTILHIAVGNFIEAAIMFTIFIVCYFSREFLEPKLIGSKIGIHPIITLVTIYAGFKLLGFMGMLMAPLVFIIVRDATVIFIKFIKT